MGTTPVQHLRWGHVWHTEPPAGSPLATHCLSDRVGLREASDVGSRCLPGIPRAPGELLALAWTRTISGPLGLSSQDQAQFGDK